MRSARLSISVALILTLGCGAGAGSGARSPAADAPPRATAGEQQPPAGPCDDLEARAAAVWNPQIRGDVDFSIKIYAGEITAADAEWLATRMDRFTLAWVRLGRATCAARFDEGTLTEDEYAGRVSCFDAALEQQREVVATLETSGRDAGNDMDALFGQLSACVPEDASPELDIRGNPFKRGGK
jgi:hypothetical protein